jgi:hypothetical protein
LNGVKPYQRTVATGSNGASDYSTWKYKLDHSYSAVKEGSNKLTAKITCLDNPYSLTKWTSVHLIGSRVDDDRTTITGIAQPTPLRISTSVDKNPITAGDIQAITVRVHDTATDTKNSAVSGAKVSGKVIDLSSFISSSFSSKNMNKAIKQFRGITDKNGKVSYSWQVPRNIPIGTPYVVEVNAVSGKYNGRSDSNIFTVKPSNNDNPFILAQASKNFTNDLDNKIKNFTQEKFNKVGDSLK